MTAPSVAFIDVPSEATPTVFDALASITTPVPSGSGPGLWRIRLLNDAHLETAVGASLVLPLQVQVEIVGSGPSGRTELTVQGADRVWLSLALAVRPVVTFRDIDLVFEAESEEDSGSPSAVRGILCTGEYTLRLLGCTAQNSTDLEGTATFLGNPWWTDDVQVFIEDSVISGFRIGALLNSPRSRFEARNSVFSGCSWTGVYLNQVLHADVDNCVFEGNYIGLADHRVSTLPDVAPNAIVGHFVRDCLFDDNQVGAWVFADYPRFLNSPSLYFVWERDEFRAPTVRRPETVEAETELPAPLLVNPKTGQIQAASESLAWNTAVGLIAHWRPAGDPVNDDSRAPSYFRLSSNVVHLLDIGFYFIPHSAAGGQSGRLHVDHNTFTTCNICCLMVGGSTVSDWAPSSGQPGTFVTFATGVPVQVRPHPSLLVSHNIFLGKIGLRGPPGDGLVPLHAHGGVEFACRHSTNWFQASVFSTPVDAVERLGVLICRSVFRDFLMTGADPTIDPNAIDEQNWSWHTNNKVYTRTVFVGQDPKQGTEEGVPFVVISHVFLRELFGGGNHQKRAADAFVGGNSRDVLGLEASWDPWTVRRMGAWESPVATLELPDGISPEEVGQPETGNDPGIQGPIVIGSFVVFDYRPSPATDVSGRGLPPNGLLAVLSEWGYTEWQFGEAPWFALDYYRRPRPTFGTFNSWYANAFTTEGVFGPSLGAAEPPEPEESD